MNIKINIALTIFTLILFFIINKAFGYSEYMNYEEEFKIQQQKELNYFKEWDRRIFEDKSYILDNIDIPNLFIN